MTTAALTVEEVRQLAARIASGWCGWDDLTADDVQATQDADAPLPYVTRLRILRRMSDVHEYGFGHRHDGVFQAEYEAWDVA